MVGNSYTLWTNHAFQSRMQMSKKICMCLLKSWSISPSATPFTLATVGDHSNGLVQLFTVYSACLGICSMPNRHFSPDYELILFFDISVSHPPVSTGQTFLRTPLVRRFISAQRRFVLTWKIDATSILFVKHQNKGRLSKNMFALQSSRTVPGCGCVFVKLVVSVLCAHWIPRRCSHWHLRSFLTRARWCIMFVMLTRPR